MHFASCKSQPKKMISGNASTFLSAAEELKSLFRSPSLHDSLSKQGAEWQFISKRAPWFSGFWEHLIGFTKTTLKKVLGRTYVSLAGLQTITTEIEAILSDRPITYVSSNIGEPEPLTPSHLLYGRCITRLPHQIIKEDELDNPTFNNDSEIRERAKRQSIIVQ